VPTTPEQDRQKHRRAKITDYVFAVLLGLAGAFTLIMTLPNN
jgi:hypothetical protein